MKLTYPDYIVVNVSEDGYFNFKVWGTFTERNRISPTLRIAKLKLHELPRDLHARINMLRLSLGNTFNEDLGFNNGGKMLCVKIDLDELRFLESKADWPKTRYWPEPQPI